MGNGAFRSFGTVLRLVLTIAAAGFLALAARGAAPQASVPALGIRYQFTDLGTLGGPNSAAFAINAVGQVVGAADVDSSSHHAFLWTPGGTDGDPANPQMRDLGTLGGTYSEALGVNSAGQVVGDSLLPDSYPGTAFLWTHGGTDGPASNPEMQDLGTLGGSYASATGIDDAGRIVGTSATKATDGYGDEFSHAFAWTAGGMEGPPANPQMKDLTPGLRGDSQANAVSPSGVIVGDVGDYPREAAQWGAAPHWLGDLGGKYSEAEAVSSDGRIVGDGTLPRWKGLPYAIAPYYFPPDHAFLWDGTMRDVGVHYGNFNSASGVNTVGQVIVTNDYHTFIWRQGRTTLLDNAAGPDSYIEECNGINDRGQIVGQADTDAGYHAFLLSPYSICGKVLLKGRGLAGVRVTVGSSTVVTAADGTYIAPIPDAGTYKVVPELRKYSFSPAFQSVTATPCAGPINFAAAK